MSRFSCSALLAFVGVAFSMTSDVRAQTLGADFAADYSLLDLGSVNGVPTNYGGLALKLGDPNTLIIGGSANGPAGKAYSIPTVRNSAGHITGFSGTAVVYGDAAYNDGGFAYAPNGAFLYTKYSANQIGQWKPGTTTDARIIDLTPLGVTSSVGGVGFVPQGQPGAGRLKVLSFNSGKWYDMTFNEAADRTYDITAATLKTTLAAAPEGFVYVPKCSPGFFVPSVLICEFGQGRVSAYRITADGDPIPATRRDFVTGLTGAEGCFIDPLTGDFVFGTYGGGNRLIRVTGFPNPDGCKADLNKDCFVNGDDFDAYVAFFEAGEIGADYNEDGFVNGDDFDAFVKDFESGC